ncbi:MAG: sulfatase/phosphatase domain-containing protein, partial [Burkholderiales bacterium]
HRLPNYHGILQKLGYETAHVGKWHMGNDGQPRPGYDHWVSFDGHGSLTDPKLNVNGTYVQRHGYMTDLLNEAALEYLRRRRAKPFALFFAHKAVHPDAHQAADGTLELGRFGGYIPAERHRGLYAGAVFPKTPNMRPGAELLRQAPAWAEAFELKASERSRQLLAAIQAGSQEEIRQRARMMASVDEGVGALLGELEAQRRLDDTAIVFLGDNGYFFGEHGLGPERRFAYEAGIRSPFVMRYPRKAKAGTRIHDLVICQDIAPTFIELAGGRPGAQMQGRSFVPLLAGRRRGWRRSFLIEYWAEQAMPWLVGMSYKAVRTGRHKLIHWVNRGTAGELDELYDLERDPWEMKNLARSRGHAAVRARMRRELRGLVADALGI